MLDDETGLYYLRSRYFSAVVSRFLNPDIVICSAISLHNHNLFSYCRNKPIHRFDVDGFGDNSIAVKDNFDDDVEVAPSEEEIVGGGSSSYFSTLHNGYFGRAGGNSNRRVLIGTQETSWEFYEELTDGYLEEKGASYDGLRRLLAGGGWITWRPNSLSGGIAIDINGVPGFKNQRIHFIKGR